MDWRKLITGALTSRTLAGGVSLFGLVAGDVRFQGSVWIRDYQIPLTDGNVVVALVALLFVAWGRAKAAGPLITDKPTYTPETSESRGFPRA